MIKAVLFDVDGVLLDSFEANFQFYKNLLTQAGYNNLTKSDFLRLTHFPMKDVIKNATHASEEEIERIYQLGRESTTLYPTHLLNLPKDAEKIVERLSKNYTLGIVTSRIKNGIYTIPQLKKMQNYFQIAVGFEDTVNHKPHSDPLFFAIKSLDVNPTEAIYIGDAESDVMAAKGVGMKAILFANENFANADAYTPLFKELPDIIASF